MEVSVGQTKLIVIALLLLQELEFQITLPDIPPLQAALAATATICQQVHRCSSNIQLYNPWGTMTLLLHVGGIGASTHAYFRCQDSH